MQLVQDYRQRPPCVNTAFQQATRRQRGQMYHANVRIGARRVRVSGDFDAIMGWVRLALAEKEAAA